MLLVLLHLSLQDVDFAFHLPKDEDTITLRRQCDLAAAAAAAAAVEHHSAHVASDAYNQARTRILVPMSLPLIQLAMC